MVLEQFIIDADIIWDQVGKTFFENPEAKAGRIMRVQVVNAGIIEDLTGYTLNLGWTSVRDPSKFGLDAFDDVDITKGIFEIEYTSGMLTNVGPLNASLQLVPPGQGRPIESNNFKLTVKNSAINAEAIQSETSFKALENALVEVNSWNARIDEVEQEFKDRAEALDGAYPVRLTDVEQKYTLADARISNIVATAGDGTIPSELSDIRVGKGGDLYLSAGDFTRAASEGRVPKTNIDNIYAHKISGATHTSVLTNRTYNGRTLGVQAQVGLTALSMYWYLRARMVGKLFSDIKTKKFRVVVRSDRELKCAIRNMNGSAWGSAGGELGLLESFNVTLDVSNNYEATAVFDYSQQSYADFYADPLRVNNSVFQEVYFAVLLNENSATNNAIGTYNFSMEVSEVAVDTFEDLTVGRQVVSATYADKAGNAHTATTATTATTAITATSAGTAAKATVADRAISSDFAVNAGLGNFFATGKLAWEGIGAAILDLEKYNTLRIKYAAGVATGSIYYVRIKLCDKVSDLIGRTVLLNGKNLNAGVAGDIADTGYAVGFSFINSGQWGNVKYAWSFATTLDGDEVSGDSIRASLIAAGATDDSSVYVQLSNSSAYYAQTPYSCDKTVQVLLTAKAGETNVVATKLAGFNPADYMAKGEGTQAIPLTVLTYSGSSATFNAYSKTVSGLVTNVTRPEIPNPDSLWSYGLVSVNLGPLSELANKQIFVHFDDSASVQKFRMAPLITKAYTNWSNSMALPTYETEEFYKVYEAADLYDAIVANGNWLPTDNVFFCFTYDLSAGTNAGTIVPETNVNMSVLTLTNADYTAKTSLQVADLLNGFNPGDYALASDLATAVEEVLTAADYITCWGDSLTAGGGWTTTLGTLAGKTVYNGGTGGENVPTIAARQGADVMVINNITIPANNTDTILIASKNVEGGIKTAFGKTVTPLLQGGAHVNPVMIDGIEGTLSWTGSSYSDPLGTWTFRRSVAGAEKVINRPTAIRTEFDRNKNGGIQIIFIGQNGGYADDADLINTHKLMMTHSTAKHTIILGLSSGSAASRADYEAAMRKEFGRYFISLREYLSIYGIEDAGLTPTQADLDAMATGTVPPQLLSDTVHYTSATKTVIGNMLYKKMLELNVL